MKAHFRVPPRAVLALLRWAHLESRAFRVEGVDGRGNCCDKDCGPLASCSTTSFPPPTGCSAFSNSFSTLTTPPSSSDVWEDTSSCVVSSSSPSLSPGTHKLVTCSEFYRNISWAAVHSRICSYNEKNIFRLEVVQFASALSGHKQCD